MHTVRLRNSSTRLYPRKRGGQVAREQRTRRKTASWYALGDVQVTCICTHIRYSISYCFCYPSPMTAAGNHRGKGGHRSLAWRYHCIVHCEMTYFMQPWLHSWLRVRTNKNGRLTKDGVAVHLHLPGMVCRGCMILHDLELTRHEWLGVALLFEKYCVAVLFEHVLGFKGSYSWDDKGWHSWKQWDDACTHAHGMNQDCVCYVVWWCAVECLWQTGNWQPSFTTWASGLGTWAWKWPEGASWQGA